MVHLEELKGSFVNSPLIWPESKNKNKPEECRKTSPYWSTFEPFYFMFRILGYMPYKLQKGESTDPADAPQIRPSVWWSLWSVVVFLVQTILFRLEIRERDDHGGVELMVLLTEDHTTGWGDVVQLLLLGMDVQFLLSWRQMPSVVKYVNDWSKYTFQFEKVTGRPVLRFGYNPHVRVVLVGSSVVLVLGLVLLDEYLFLQAFHGRIILPHFFALYYCSLLTVFWVSNCMFITLLSRSLRTLFKHSLQRTRSPKVVDQYRLLWLDLRHLLAGLSDSVSGALLVLTLVAASCCLASADRLMATASDLDASQLSALLILLQTTIAVLLALCLSSHDVAQEIGRGFELHILMCKLYFLGDKVRRQVEYFLDTIECGTVTLCVGGMLDVDRPLFLYVIVGSLAWIGIARED